MPLIAGPFHVAAGLLLVAGIAKLVKPGPTAEVARAAGVPASSATVRIFALAEVIAGAAALLVGGPIAAGAVAALYASFAVFVAMLRARDVQAAGCGCFGQASEEPPGVLHIGVDLAAAVIAVGAVASSVPDVFSVMSSQPLAGVPYVGFVVLGVWLAMVLLTDLPRLAHIAGEGAA